LHLAFLAALMMASRTRQIARPANEPVELVYLAPANVPKVRAENFHPKRLRGDTSLSVQPILAGSAASSLSPSAAASEGDGSGVDWKAEARRAVHSFEIRNHPPQGNYSVSGSPVDDEGRTRTQHNAGDRYKTASGDWIVWINSICYQISVTGASAYAPGALPPRTVCSGESDPPHGESGELRNEPVDQSASSRKPHGPR
jgi:hypothetical protein